MASGSGWGRGGRQGSSAKQRRQQQLANRLRGRVASRVRIKSARRADDYYLPF